MDEMRCTAASASLPAISISPMWLTSNRPARVRTAMCSSAMPEYSTGMSQPLKGTILAPELRWRLLSGVFLRGAVVVCSMRADATRGVNGQRYYAPSKAVKDTWLTIRP